MRSYKPSDRISSKSGGGAQSIVSTFAVLPECLVVEFLAPVWVTGASWMPTFPGTFNAEANAPEMALRTLAPIYQPANY
ncbi:MAG: hypothetical protein SFV81_11365 [Pirellulaceae bacterium]|nr:hypothetical protein [Pirellulaceae bacterium]